MRRLYSVWPVRCARKEWRRRRGRVLLRFPPFGRLGGGCFNDEAGIGFREACVVSRRPLVGGRWLLAPLGRM